jgi:hypothetical protein
VTNSSTDLRVAGVRSCMGRGALRCLCTSFCTVSLRCSIKYILSGGRAVWVGMIGTIEGEGYHCRAAWKTGWYLGV